MLPKSYRKTYSLIVLISLLLHLVLLWVLLYHPISLGPEEIKKNTVVINLKAQDEPESQEPKKAEPKKAEPKKAEPKTAEPKTAEPKTAEPKTAEPKTAEPKTAEPKTVEPKKAEPKKAEPKKAEPKKAEPKKAEPKKAEPKKAEPKTAEPKKTEPKKTEPKKTEPKKAEPKKAEPKKTEPKKAEPKKAEPKKAEPKKAEPKKSEPRKAEPKKAEPKKSEPKKAKPRKAEPKKAEPETLSGIKSTQQGTPREQDAPKQINMKRGKEGIEGAGDAKPFKGRGYRGMKELTNEEYNGTAVLTKGPSTVFSQQKGKGDRVLASLSHTQKIQFTKSMQSAFQHLIRNVVKRNYKYDGPPFKGEIQFLIDTNGNVTHVNLKTPSPVKELDEDMIKTVLRASPLPMPKGLQDRIIMSQTTKLFFYDQDDL